MLEALDGCCACAAVQKNKNAISSRIGNPPLDKSYSEMRSVLNRFAYAWQRGIERREQRAELRRARLEPDLYARLAQCGRGDRPDRGHEGALQCAFELFSLVDSC